MDDLPREICSILIELIPDCRPISLTSRGWYEIYRCTPDWKFWRTRPLFRPKYALPKHVAISTYRPEDYARWGNLDCITIPCNVFEVTLLALRLGHTHIMEKFFSGLPIREQLWCADTTVSTDGVYLKTIIHAIDINELDSHPSIMRAFNHPVPDLIRDLIAGRHYGKISILLDSAWSLNVQNIPPLFQILPEESSEIYTKLRSYTNLVHVEAIKYDPFSLYILHKVGMMINPSPCLYITRIISTSHEIAIIATIFAVRRYGVITKDTTDAMTSAGLSAGFIKKVAGSLPESHEETAHFCAKK